MASYIKECDIFSAFSLLQVYSLSHILSDNSAFSMCGALLWTVVDCPYILSNSLWQWKENCSRDLISISSKCHIKIVTEVSSFDFGRF